jgi:hypothetical protein
MKSLKLKNSFLFNSQNAKSLLSFLFEMQLHGAESRGRNRFIKLCSDREGEISAEYKKLLVVYSTKDKDGKTIYFDKEGKETITDTGSVQLDKTKISEFNAELAKYLAEDFIIDITPANNEVIQIVKKLLLESTINTSEYQSVMYDNWCEAFETIKEE